MNLAEGITVRQEQESELDDFREFFPDFLWLLRDVSLKMVDESGREMDPTEYLKTKVLRRNYTAMRESTSDTVGQAILTFFPSVECAKLERPSDDPQIMNDIAQHTDKLNPGFNKGVDELMKKLLEKARAKRGYDKASAVSGVALSIMAKEYVEAVNDPNSIPALDNTWKITIQLMQNKAIEEAVQEYNKLMQAGVAGARKTENGEVPLEEYEALGGHEDTEGERNIPRQPSLMELHNASFREATVTLLKKVGHFGINSENQGTDESNSVVDQMQNRLVQRAERTVDYMEKDGKPYQQKGLVVTGGELFKYIQQNKENSRVFCQETFQRLFDPIRKHVETPPPDYDFKQLLEELDHARQKYKEQARGPEKWAVLK
ncbi:guanylate-binding protein 1-like [Branchiostoma floridae]|uniref:Guanylate-binding protein 1-like n=1 Tax=Branchiostoma floridae TaxID=7739 RepID=A0A9J7HPI2_BRAFL|nr:guanylate-binding protein 1-like [Branchiostoma floridae]